MLPLFISFLAFLLLSSPLNAKDFSPPLGNIYTELPAQLVKENTASHYIFTTANDIDGDGVADVIIGANCSDKFCENFMFKVLNNKRYQYLGKAAFNQENYELIYTDKNNFADILFFKQENVGQGCLGRYKYDATNGYQQKTLTCRLPRQVSDLLSSYRPIPKPEPVIVPKRPNPDEIDFSNIKFDDIDLDAFYPKAEQELAD